MGFRRAFITIVVITSLVTMYLECVQSTNAQETRSVESLLQDLNHPYPAVREQSASALAHLGVAVVEPLIAVLRRGDPLAQEQAAYALWRIKDPSALASLILATKHRVAGVRFRAVQAVGAFNDPRVIRPLIAGLTDSDLFVRRAAVEALGNQRDPRSIKPLMRMWLSDDDSMVIEMARQAVVNIGEPAVDELIAALAASDYRTQWFAADALGRIRNVRAIDSLVAAFSDTKNPSTHSHVADALTQFGATAVESLIAALENQQLSDYALSEITQALGRIGDSRALDPLVAALNHKSVYARWGAARALGLLHDVRAVEPLIEALKSESSIVRAAAAEGLGQLKDARAVEPIKTILNDPDLRVRLFAVQALWATAGADSADALVALARDSEVTVRTATFEALSKVDDARLYKTMLAGLKDESNGIQSYAEQWLVKLGTASVDDLIGILKVPDSAFAAREEKRLEAVARLKADPNAQIFFAICGNEPEALPSNPQQWAARALGKIGDIRSVEPLIAALSTENGELRFESAKALVLIAHPVGEQEAVLTQQLASADPAVRAEAIAKLRKALSTRPATNPRAVSESPTTPRGSRVVPALAIFASAGVFAILIPLLLKLRDRSHH